LWLRHDSQDSPNLSRAFLSVGVGKAALGFWRAYRSAIPQAPWIEPATLEHFGWLLLARIDGKSPVEYLREHLLQDQVRQFARNLILSSPKSVAELFGKL